MIKHKPNIAILASGSGSNFAAIARSAAKGFIKANIKLLVTDQKDAYVRTRAKNLKILEVFIDPKDYSSRESFDLAIIKLLKKEKIDFVVLAGFMRMISPKFVNAYKNKIVNIHPAILPAFKGLESIKQAYDWGCKLAGVTVHFVDTQMDHGPIILQEAVKITSNMGLAELENKIHKIEHRLYPQAIKLLVEGKLKISQRKVKITGL